MGKYDTVKLEDVIFSRDAYLTKLLVDSKIFKLTIGKLVKVLTNYSNKDLILNYIKCTPKNFSDIYKFTEEYSKKIGITPPMVYIRKSDIINAYTYGTQDRAYVVIHSKLLDTFPFDELKFVIGHELGHIAAGHTQILTLLNYLLGMFDSMLKSYIIRKLPFLFVTPFLRLLLLSWEKSAEITADRFGFIASKDKKISFNALINLKLGMIHYTKIDYEEYLKQYDEITDNLLYKINEVTSHIFSTHPNIFRRIIALNLFADNFNSGYLSNKELDKKIFQAMGGKNREIFTAEENYESLLIKAMFYIAQADGIIVPEERKLILKVINKLMLSDNLKEEIKDFMEKDVKLSDFNSDYSLTENQKNFLVKTLFDVAISDKVYSIEEDKKIMQLMELSSIPAELVAETRERIIKQYGNLKEWIEE